MSEVNQRNATNNQSTADYSCDRIFLFDNKYQEGIFKNNTAGALTLKAGMLVLRDTTTPTQVVPAIAGATLVDVIGIVKLSEDVELAAGETVDINFAISGDIDETYLVLPDTVTLETVPTGGTRTLRDTLNALGLALKGSVQNTKFDN